MFKVSVVVLLLMLTAACGSESDTASSGPHVRSTADLVKLLRQTQSFDYDPYPTPTAMLSAVDIALVGTVASVDAAMLNGEGENLGAVVVGLEPTEMWKDDPNRSGDVIHFYFSRPTNLDIELYRDGLPTGTQVVLFAGAVTDDIDSFAEGDPGGIVYGPTPQGYYIANADDRLVNIWADDITTSGDWPNIDSIADLREAIGR